MKKRVDEGGTSSATMAGSIVVMATTVGAVIAAGHETATPTRPA